MAERIGRDTAHSCTSRTQIQVEFELLNQGYVPLDGLNPLSLWDLHYALEAEESLKSVSS